MKTKSIKIVFILLALIIFSVFIVFITDFSGGQEPAWGVTFSRSYTLDLQLDWRETYLAILDDLKISHLRLVAYWDEIEPEKDSYNFTDMDWQIREASAREVSIILAIGRRLPRWPECHDPGWAKHLTPAQTNQEILELLEMSVTRYQDNKKIVAWQIENEPLFAWFGFCPPPNKEFLEQEIALVKSVDPRRPILITDSGELSNWQKAASLADVFGTTLYRIVWNKKLGFWDYRFVPPAFYRYKADITRFFQPHLQKVIITEMQMEPWTMDRHMTELTQEEQNLSFNLERFRSNIEYVKKTGFREVYLWGVEYWYWLKEQGNPEMWEEAKKLWQ